MARIRITEYLDVNLENEMWCCNRCGEALISASDNYKRGCLVSERKPEEIYEPIVVDGVSVTSPDPSICRIVEFYCPNCLIMVENENLPPGHPITYDIELDVDSLKGRFERGEIWEEAIIRD
jgi:acetone carboxylase gamma subunit